MSSIMHFECVPIIYQPSRLQFTLRITLTGEKATCQRSQQPIVLGKLCGWTAHRTHRSRLGYTTAFAWHHWWTFAVNSHAFDVRCDCWNLQGTAMCSADKHSTNESFNLHKTQLRFKILLARHLCRPLFWWKAIESSRMGWITYSQPVVRRFNEIPRWINYGNEWSNSYITDGTTLCLMRNELKVAQETCEQPSKKTHLDEIDDFGRYHSRFHWRPSRMKLRAPSPFEIRSHPPIGNHRSLKSHLFQLIHAINHGEIFTGLA